MELNLPTSIRRFIRREKSRIRQEFFDTAKQKELINELYKKFIKTKPAGSTGQPEAKIKPKSKPAEKTKKVKKAK
jgi:hypothetical protein